MNYGFFSVLGSVGAVALGMEWSIRGVLKVGAAIYVLAGAALFLGSRRIPAEGVIAVAPTGSLGRAFGLLLLVALCWFAAFAFLSTYPEYSASPASHPRPPVPPKCGRRPSAPFDETDLTQYSARFKVL